MDRNAQSLAWREAVGKYGTDPLAITGAPHRVSSTSWICLTEEQSKKAKVVRSAYFELSLLCRICNVVCNSDKVYNDHLAGPLNLGSRKYIQKT
ncbi:hypothetical protein EUTSA_v10028085mg [Eutrema salsugineum]|uniref:C2H2-type domain-containing protein n=1 Tax=Eutrema salsugineum TaxID=72664 RepID=V4LU93_EUTSA|nr:hypothetical protein EUTSA_v10028085mg [Eutrema salsugineum]